MAVGEPVVGCGGGVSERGGDGAWACGGHGAAGASRGERGRQGRGEQGAAPDKSNAGEARACRGGRARPVRDWARLATSDGVERARGAAGGVRK